MVRNRIKIIEDVLSKSLNYGKNKNFTISELDLGDDEFSTRFKISEIRGWIWGLWIWKDQDVKKRYHISVFGCDERDVNKFKPSRVSAVKEITYDLNSEYNDNFSELFQYVYKNHVLADYRELTGADFNFDYCSKLRAFVVVKRYRIREWFRNNAEMFIYRRVIKKLSRIYREYFPSYKLYLIDRGDCWSPRFDFHVVVNKPNDEFRERGCYGLDSVYETVEKTTTFWRKLLRCFGINLYFLHGVSTAFDVVFKKDWKRWYKYATTSTKYDHPYVVKEIK